MKINPVPCSYEVKSPPTRECVNMIPKNDGNIHRIEATKNAVIVQLFKRDTDMDETIERFICIECVDADMLPALKEEANKFIKQNN